MGATRRAEFSKGREMMVLIQLNNGDDVADDADGDGDYLGSKVCQRCVMRRDQRGSHCAKAKPEGPKKTATQSHGFTQCWCVYWCARRKTVCESLTASHTLHIESRKI